MSQDYEIQRLAEVFERLGADDPQGWARSQIEEGIPQLARFLLLKEAWERVISEHDFSWMDQELRNAEADPTAPYAGIGLALRRLVDAGASRSDLADLVRGMQVTLLFSLLYMLDDPGPLADEVGTGWGLVEVSPDGELLGGIPSLHESVLETDPTGREMRPRAASGPDGA